MLENCDTAGVFAGWALCRWGAILFFFFNSLYLFTKTSPVELFFIAPIPPLHTHTYRYIVLQSTRIYVFLLKCLYENPSLLSSMEGILFVLWLAQTWKKRKKKAGDLFIDHFYYRTILAIGYTNAHWRNYILHFIPAWSVVLSFKLHLVHIISYFMETESSHPATYLQFLKRVDTLCAIDFWMLTAGCLLLWTPW